MGSFGFDDLVVVAHLDKSARRTVVNAFENKFSGKTRILITQDKELSKVAKKTVILENGKIREKTSQ